MTAYLLDVNVLIALIDGAHIHHEIAHKWFANVGNKAWATCPLTENAVVRIVGHSRYPNSRGTPAAVAEVIMDLLALPGHVFWPDDVSLFNTPIVEIGRLLNSRQVTDSYLLALACAHDGLFATFDRRVATEAVRGGSTRVHLI